MADHAKLMSPSSSERRIACPGSYVLEGLVPDKASQPSDDGTAMHWVASECLTTDRDARAFVGRWIDVHDAGEPQRRVQFTEDFADLVQVYVDAVRDELLAGGRAELVVEQKVDFSDVVGMPLGTQFGTLDCAIYKPAEKLLIIWDFKSGFRRVDATMNSQLMLYAIGERIKRDMLGDDVERIVLRISQPKLSDTADEWECPLDVLDQFAEKACKATKMCEAAMLCYQGVASEGFAETYLNPGDDQCQFCRAAGTCPALRGTVARVTTFSPKLGQAHIDDFDIVDADGTVSTVEPVVSLNDATAGIGRCTPDQLGRLLMMVPLVETWTKAVLAEGDRRLLAGQVVPGFKVVAGKRGARRWTDAEAAEAQLKAMRLRVEEMYDLKLISPTTAEKLTKPGEDGKPALGPRQWQKLQALISQPEGKPSVVPVSDKRPALQITPPAEDFEIVERIVDGKREAPALACELA